MGLLGPGAIVVDRARDGKWVTDLNKTPGCTEHERKGEWFDYMLHEVGLMVPR